LLAGPTVKPGLLTSPGKEGQGHMSKEQTIKTLESPPNSVRDERRRRPRFPFTADFEGLEPKSNIRIEGRVSDIGMGGCYVNTINPFPQGTLMHIRIRKENECFAAQAKVTYSQLHMGMGLIFVSAAQDQVILFQKWLLALSGAVAPLSDPSASAAQDGSAAKAKADPGEVLNELLVLLTRKGLLTEEEGSVMLRKLRR
jgi:hypothetical protein